MNQNIRAVRTTNPMTQEQISQLAREYAVDRGLAGCENPCARTMMLDAIDWLLRDHLIVEKNKVQERFQDVVERNWKWITKDEQ